MLQKPICIIGAARSGTTLLGRLLSRHPNVAYWNEPKYLWAYRNPTTSHDKRTEEEATPHVREYIRSQLEQYVKENKATRLVEKSPSNCFRVPFVHAVLPEARFVHLIRDGRDAAVSAWEQWKIVNDVDLSSDEVGPTRRLIRNAWGRLRSDDVPLVDLPFYGVRFAQTFLRRIGFESGSTEVSLWGPEFPGILEVVQEHDLLEACAIQWAKSVRAASRGLQSVPIDQRLTLRFRNLVQEPSSVMESIFDFADLPLSEKTVSHAEKEVRPGAANRWRDRDSETIERVMKVAGDLVRDLNDQAEV